MESRWAEQDRNGGGKNFKPFSEFAEPAYSFLRFLEHPQRRPMNSSGHEVRCVEDGWCVPLQ